MSSYNDYQHWPQESTSNTDEDELSSPEIDQEDSDEDTESSTSSTSTSATSSSGSSQSGSDSESTSTAEEDEVISLKTETALANKTELCLPAGMCEEEGVFKQLFSVNSWVCLSEQQKQHLKNFLPKFPENDLMEKEITLRMLFGGQSFRFGVNPIDDFHDKLKNGHFRPDIVKMKSLLRRSLKREYRKNQRIYNFNMLKKLLLGRKKAIDDLNGFSSTPMSNISGSNSFTMHQQVRRRYFQELSDIKNLVGDDSDNSSDSYYQDGPPARLSKKQRRHLGVVQNSLSPELETITSTLASYPDGIDLSKIALPMSNPFDPTEDMYKEMLVSHKRKQKKIEQEQEQMRFNLVKENNRPTISLGTEKKRSAVNDRPRVKRTKSIKNHMQPIQPSAQIDVKPVRLDLIPTLHLDELHNTAVKQEQTHSEPSTIPYIKKEVHQDVPALSPPLPLPPPLLPSIPPSLSLPSPPPTISIPDIIDEEESLKTNLNAIKLEPCLPIKTDIVKLEEKILQDIKSIKVEPMSLTADEIRKAEEGQVAAAMLLEQMSDVEQKYNPPLTPSPPPPPPPPPPSSENISNSKFSPPTYLNKREFHPEDMLTSTVQSINTQSPSRMLNSCLHSLTPSDYGSNSKRLSLSPVTTPSKVITDTNYVGALSDFENFHVLDFKPESNADLEIKPLSEPTKHMTASFFALIRDIICSTWEYRMSKSALFNHVTQWAKSTKSNLKNPDWYISLESKTWKNALELAIRFLGGQFPEWQPEDFVPYIEFKTTLDSYQWIGAGRDSDTRIGELCKSWLHNLNNSSKLKSIKEEVISSNNLPIPSTTDIISTIDMSETDSSITLPTPLLDTWIVTPSNYEERSVFQTQEKERFAKPHRSFIYRMHGYESVVGPVRGIYNSSNIHKAARGHSLLIENRPHFISILVLVRDATARLPNGMGTRSDICTLLKDSQYLMEASQTELHNAVSGALDRLHYEHDPCVKYDPKRKIWIYLHRGRTLEEFERLHLEQQGAVKMKCWRRNKTPKKILEPKQTPNRKPTSNVLLESFSMLDLPSSSTSDSLPSSSTSPVLSDANMRVTQEIKCIDHSKLPIKTPRVVKNRKTPVQNMQTSDNEVELKIECPTKIEQNRSSISQMFAMPVSNNISTVTTNNISTITASNITSQLIASNIASRTIASNIANQSIVSNIANQSIASNIVSQSIASNIASQSIANNIVSQSVANNIVSQPIASNIASQSIANNIVTQTIANNIASQSVASKIRSHQMVNTISSQVIANNITNQSITNNILSQSMANTNLKVINTQTVTNSRQMINMAQTTSSSNQTLVNNNRMVVNSISANKQVLSGDLIAIGTRKKKHVQIAQPVTIGPSSGSSNFQHDHHLNITKSPQNKEHQRQILVLKQKLSDHSVSNSEQTKTVVGQTDNIKSQNIHHLLQIQQQHKLQKQQQMQLKLMQRKQIQQQTLQQNKQQVIIRKSDMDDKTESGDGEHPQVIFLKQGQRGVQTEPQQITQQQLQQLLMMRPQQQTGHQTQVVMVKQPGNDQKTIAVKPILTSLCGTKMRQNPPKAANLLVQANQSAQNVQRRITKPFVGKLMSNPRTQLPVDSVLANRKLPGVVPQGTSLRISGVQASKCGQPQYTVVTVAQPKLLPSNQLNIGQQTPSRLSAINDRLKPGDNQPQTVRVVQSQIGGKPVLVTNKSQISTTITGVSTSSNIVSSSMVNSTANTYTVVQQGSQQILVPASSLKSIHGLKVIPLSQHNVKGRPQVFARLVNPDGVRPMFIHQSSPNQNTNQGPSESNT